jgi:hypothetical protein
MLHFSLLTCFIVFCQIQYGYLFRLSIGKHVQLIRLHRSTSFNQRKLALSKFSLLLSLQEPHPVPIPKLSPGENITLSDVLCSLPLPSGSSLNEGQKAMFMKGLSTKLTFFSPKELTTLLHLLPTYGFSHYKSLSERLFIDRIIDAFRWKGLPSLTRRECIAFLKEMTVTCSYTWNDLDFTQQGFVRDIVIKLAGRSEKKGIAIKRGGLIKSTKRGTLDMKEVARKFKKNNWNEKRKGLKRNRHQRLKALGKITEKKKGRDATIKKIFPLDTNDCLDFLSSMVGMNMLWNLKEHKARTDMSVEDKEKLMQRVFSSSIVLKGFNFERIFFVNLRDFGKNIIKIINNSRDSFLSKIHLGLLSLGEVQQKENFVSDWVAVFLSFFSYFFAAFRTVVVSLSCCSFF